MNRLSLGIDGGGSRCRAALLDDGARVVARAEAGPVNPRDVGFPRAAALVHELRERVCSAAGVPIHEIHFCGLGIAGVGGEGDRAAFVEALRKLPHALADSMNIVSDLEAARHGAFDGGPGILLVAGTGSAAFGLSKDGSQQRAGGLGPRFDDPGSAAWIAAEGLGCVLRGLDGRGLIPAFASEMTEALGGGEARDLAKAADRLTRHELAALAPLVTAAAPGGCSCARSILTRGAAELCAMAAAVAKKLEWTAPPISLHGGVMDNAEGYRDLVVRALEKRLPDGHVIRPLRSAAEGAALISRP